MRELVVLVIGYLRGIWRYRWWVLGIAWVVSSIGWVTVATLPDQYQATAKVYVDTDSLLKPLLRGLAVTGSERQRLLLMTKTLLSRPNLEEVMRMTDLDLQAKTPEDTERIIAMLESNIRLGSTREINLYTISYEDSDPNLAKLVVKSLLTLFVESSLGDSRKDQDSARKFLEQQIADYERRMVEAEARRAEFKRRNLGFLEGEGNDYYSRLRENQAMLKQAELDLKIQQDRLTSIEEQMEDVEEGDSDSLFEDELIPTESIIATVYDGRIQELETNLDDLLLRYTEKHPDVIGTRRTIEQLKDKARTEQERLAGLQMDDGGEGLASSNPIYQQLRLTYADAKANVAAQKAVVEEYGSRIEQLEKAVDKVLQVETEQKQLNRDYGIMQSQHQTLLGRLESARMTQDVNVSGSVQFRIVEPPRVPSKPSGPPRILYSSGLLVVGLGLGIALAFFLSQLRPTFDDRRTLNEVTGLPVLGSVSMVWTESQVLKRKRRHQAFSMGLVSLVALYGLVLAAYLMDVDWVYYVNKIQKIASI